MCTVTVVPVAIHSIRTARSPLVRLVCNRDEQRSRPASGGLVRRRVGDRTAIMPIDPPSHGTWIGANDAGMVACLLNVNSPNAASSTHLWAARFSRGEIVPALLAATTIEDALNLIGGIEATRYPPFRVLVLNAASFMSASSDGASLTLAEPAALQLPLFLTSSGLGDDVVEQPRRELFDRMVCRAEDPLAAQAQFHEHRWHSKPHLSVLMSRPDARTVCRCEVDVLSDSIALSHSTLNEGLVADRPVSRGELSVRRTEAAA